MVVKLKRILLVFLSLFIIGCSDELEQNGNEKLDSEFKDRFKVSELELNGGNWIRIFTDTKTGREFLAYNHGLVEIKPKEEINK